MTERVPPHDLDAEAAVLGACMLSPQQIEPCSEIVEAADFWKPSHGHVFQVIVDLWEDGVQPDAVAVANSLRRRGLLDQAGGPAALVKFQAETPATSTAPQKAAIVADLAALRRLLKLSDELRDQAYDQRPAGQLVDWVTARAEELDVAGVALPSNFSTVSEFMDRPEEQRADWVIPGQVRERWRVIFVGTGGVGKSTLLRQIALCVAQGVNPFDPTQRIEPVPTLHFDCENPDEAIDEQVTLINRRLWQVLKPGEFDPAREGLFRDESGINVRSRRDRSKIEAVLAHHRPKLVCAGPVYKMYEREAGERGHEDAVREFHRAWDRWRVRYGFALILEHHPPLTKSSGGEREMRPSDSSHWERWVDYGFGLSEVKKEPGSYRMSRWSGDRMQASWPTRMSRGQLWPWEFSWPKDKGVPPDELF